jgi:hypothetical protein
VFRVIPLLNEEIKSSKSPLVRIKLAEYLYLIVTLWFPHSPDPFLHLRPPLEESLAFLLQDAKSEARQLARMSFFRFHQLYPDSPSTFPLDS